MQVAAGSLGQPPAPSGQKYQLSVRAVGRLPEASEFDNIILKSGKDGALVRLKDIGRAELGAETYAAKLRFQGVEAVGFGVIAVAFRQLARRRTRRQRRAGSPRPVLSARHALSVAFNTTDVVQASIAEVLKTLVEAIALVVLVIFVFLQTWRSTLIPAITIPVSLVGAFAFVKVMGFSINTLTLFGIILATGIVVDDAIVVIENIERHIQEYKVSARKAASDAMGEVFGAVVATGLVLIAVFVPVAFFPGTTGRLYAQFSITIAFAVALSVFNAVTLTPALSALLLGRSSHGKWRIFALFERLVDAGTHAYVAILRRALRIRWVVVLLFFGTVAAPIPVPPPVISAWRPSSGLSAIALPFHFEHWRKAPTVAMATRIHRGKQLMKTRAAVAFEAKKPLEIVELDLEGPRPARSWSRSWRPASATPTPTRSTGSTARASSPRSSATKARAWCARSGRASPA